MPYFTKPTAEELIGMKAEDLKAKLDSAATKEDLNTISEAQKQNATTLAEIQESLKALTPQPKLDSPPPDDPNDDTIKVLADPRKFIADHTKDLNDMTVKTRVDLMEMRARNVYGPVFEEHGKELLESVAKNFTLEQRARDNFWDYAIRTFIGDKAIRGEIKSGFPSLLGPSSVAPRSSDNSDRPEDAFSPEMSSWLKDRKVPLDKALKIRNLMERDGEPITHLNYFGSGKAN